MAKLSGMGDWFDSVDYSAPVVEPVATVSEGSGWTFDSLLKDASSVVKLVTDYQRQQLPGGGTVYATIDPRTGLPIYGGSTIAPPSSVAQFVKANMGILALAGIGLLYVMTNKG